ncbi:hypothetical protein ABZ651_35015, partial [Streptomyces sp. NPDC007070]
MGESVVGASSVGPLLTGAVVLCAGVTVWLAGGRRAGARRARLLLAGGGVVGAGPPGWDRARRELHRLRDR